MRQRPPILQYLLLTLVASLSLLHAFAGAKLVYRRFLHGQATARLPFTSGYAQQTITGLADEASAAGLRRYDIVTAIDGEPYTGVTVLTSAVDRSRPGDQMSVVYSRGHGAPDQTASIQLAPFRTTPPRLADAVLEAAFSVLPLLCLLIGLWVVIARPRSLHAWLILGILAYFDPLFIATGQMSGWMLLPALYWNTIAQTAMPLCLMFFGTYFPRRSVMDRGVPWVKWLLAVPILALFPIDLLYDYGREWNFQAIRWLSPHLLAINIVENLISFAAICWFFVNIVSSIQVARGDGLRRLRVLHYGTAVGLTPFGALVIYAAARQTDVGQGVPKWLDLTVFLILLLFPLTLAYSVVVHRAVEIRILVRQGTKYFFARNTIRVLLFLLASWMTFLIVQLIQHPARRRSADAVQIFVVTALFFLFRFRLSGRLEQYLDQRFFREAYSSEQVLSELSDEARNFTERQPLLETVTQRIASTLHIERIAIFLRSGETFHLELATGSPIASQEFQSLALAAGSATITELAKAKAPANVYRDDPSSWLVDATDAERHALQDLSTELLVPLPGRSRLIGVMALGPKRSEEPYSRTDRQLLQTVASQTGLALENAELLETLTAETAQRERISREIEIAREVQQRLFPQSYPSIRGVEMAGFCRPAQAVGGDYYDFFTVGDALPGSSSQSERLALAIGDISGKGISASLLMASLRASLRSLSRVQEMIGTPDLASLMKHVNNLVYEASASNRYATFFFAELDVPSRKLTYVNAGHNPPVILRGGEVLSLAATGMVIGLLPDAEYAQAQIEMQAGDVLLAFTDGISEAMSPTEEEWGEDRMLDTAQRLLSEPDCTYSAQQLIECLVEHADRFTIGAPQHDDMTLLVCRLNA